MKRIPLIALMILPLAFIAGIALGNAGWQQRPAVLQSATAHRQPAYTVRQLETDIGLGSAIWLGKPDALLYRAYWGGPSWITTFTRVSAADMKKYHLSGQCADMFARPRKGSHAGARWLLCQNGEVVPLTWRNG